MLWWDNGVHISLEKDVSSRTRNLFYDLIAPAWGKTVDYVELLCVGYRMIVAPPWSEFLASRTKVIQRKVYQESSWSHHPALLQVKSLDKLLRVSSIPYSVKSSCPILKEGRKQKWTSRARSVPAMSKVPYKTGKQSCVLVVPWDPSYKSLQLTSSISELSTIYQRYCILYLVFPNRHFSFRSYVMDSYCWTSNHSLRYYVYSNTTPRTVYVITYTLTYLSSSVQPCRPKWLLSSVATSWRSSRPRENTSVWLNTSVTTEVREFII